MSQYNSQVADDDFFQEATIKRGYVRLALCGPSKSGKSWQALWIATEMLKELDRLGAIRRNGKIAVTDTEYESTSKYAKMFPHRHANLQGNFSPSMYVEYMMKALNFEVTILDSISHEWTGHGGTLDFKNKIVTDSKGSEDDFRAWAKANPYHESFVQAFIRYPSHIICTVRADEAHAMQKDETTGKNKVVKLGVKPIQRKSIGYEFDIWGDIGADHILTFAGTRCPPLTDRVFQPREVGSVGVILANWINDTIDGEDEQPILNPEKIEELQALGRRLRVNWARTIFPKYEIGSFNQLTEEHYQFLSVDFRRAIDKKEGKTTGIKT